MQWALGAGDCVVLLPDAYHYAVQECQEETSFYWLHFQTAPSSATGDDSISHNIKSPKHGPIPYPEQAYQLFDSLHLLATEPRSTAFWREQTLFIESLAAGPIEIGPGTIAGTQSRGAGGVLYQNALS